MNISSLIRDPNKIKSHLHTLDNGCVVCDQEMRIYIPCRFEEKNLAYLGTDNHILGVYGIVTEDKYYGVSLVNAMIPIDPTSTNKVKIDDVDYYEFVFTKGATVFKSLNLVKSNTIVYYIFDELFSNGNVPWYIGYEELGRIFETANYHAGANIGQNHEVTRLIASLVARDKEDRTKYFRQTVTTPADVVKKKPYFIPLRSVEYAATNTLNKLGGNYMSIGITSALIDRTERLENIDNLLRK